MKVIDLLNKIANDERFENCKMKFKGIEPEEVSEYVIYDRLYEEDLTLNDEVEIIEDKPKHIEELELVSLEEFKTMSPAERYHVTAKEYDKINELSKAVNYLLDKEGK